jgi:hypothetical protein
MLQEAVVHHLHHEEERILQQKMFLPMPELMEVLELFGHHDGRSHDTW